MFPFIFILGGSIGQVDFEILLGQCLEIATVTLHTNLSPWKSKNFHVKHNLEPKGLSPCEAQFGTQGAEPM